MLTLLPPRSGIDVDEVADILKGVQVAIVCVMFLSNAALIFSKISRKGCGAFSKARNAIQISLAFAGIVTALFYNVITTIIIYDMQGHGLNCMTTYLANCFFFTFLPVVYCTGLILLAIDFVLRFKSDIYTSLGSSKCYSFLSLITPWAVAFAVSCPLLLTEIEWHLKCANNQSTRHLQAAIICCTLFPIGMVLFLAMIVAVAVRPQRYYDFQRSFDSPMYTISKVTTSSSSTDNNVTSGSIKQLNGSSNGKMSTPTPIPIMPTSDDNAYQSFTYNRQKSVTREKCKLIFSMLFVAIIALPYSCLFLYVTSEYVRMYTTLLLYMVDMDVFIAYQTCSYILNLYPIVLPLTWLCTRY